MIYHNVGNLYLPSNQNQGDLPKIAVVTGDQDRLECIFRNIGINDTEFTDPTSNGSINLYFEDGAYTNKSFTTSTLLNNIGTMLNYDMIVLECTGAEYTTTPTQLENIRTFVDAGGKLFGTHFAYSYLYVLIYNLF